MQNMKNMNMPADQGVDIRSFILQTEESAPDTEKEKEVKGRQKSPVKYEVVLAAEPDFIIRRKTKRTNRLFVCLVTQNQAYLKDEETGAIETLTPGNEAAKKLAAFLRDAPEAGVSTGVRWIPKLLKGKDECDLFLRFFSSDFRQTLIKKGYISIEELEIGRHTIAWQHMDVTSKRGKVFMKMLSICYRELEKVFDDKTARSVLSDVLLNRTGLLPARYEDNLHAITKQTQDFVENAGMFLSPFFGGDSGFVELYRAYLSYEPCEGVCTNQRLYKNLFSAGSPALKEYFMEHNPRFRPRASTEEEFFDEEVIEKAMSLRSIQFKTSKMIDYLIYQAPREGYLDQNQFVRDWADTLDMEMAIYGKCEDKYPENLATTHLKLSRLSAIMKAEIDAEMMTQRYEDLKDYEYRGEKYHVIVPKTKEDILTEARQQSNCLASYAGKYTEGRCDLFFLRPAKRPDKSLVTIEVIDGKVVQVKAACNRAPSAEQAEFIDRWAKKKDLEYVPF